MDNITIVSMIAFVALIFWELCSPKRNFSTKTKIQSYLTNAQIVVTNNLILLFLSISSLYQTAESFFSLGLFSKLDYTNGFLLVGVLVLLDGTVYFWHSLNHKLPFLWMFHKAHHTEIYLNTLSGLRFHIGELLLSVLFKVLLLVMFLGIPIEIILLSEGLTMLFSMFHHTNVAFRGEKILSKLIIVPYLHQTHHSVDREAHDSNYGVIFSFWDRLFGTLLDKENKQIGLGTIKFQSFTKFLSFGFRRRY